MSDPYVGFGNDTLASRPLVRAGDKVYCSRCEGEHVLRGGVDGDGNPSELLLLYSCGEKLFLGAVNNRLVVGIKPDVSGTLGE